MRQSGLVCLLIVFLSLPVSAAEFGDIELSLYALGSWPPDRQISNQGTTAEASLKHSFGGGIRAGLFPELTKRILGLEIDSFGHGGAFSFPNQTNGQNNGTGRSNLLIFNTMFNFILRYPGETVRPYVGIGIGWTHGTLLNPNIAGRNDQDFDSAWAFGRQYLGGLQVMVTPKVFLFSEYRYFSANYHWESLSLNYRTHYGLIGAGLRF
jgi:opacity protein-like surface antigen